MWSWIAPLKFQIARKVRLVLPRAALNEVFDECDRFDEDETGGRIIGHYSEEPDGSLTVHVTGIVESGPGTKRSPVSLFQDGEYQERIFRRIEWCHPELEHLGNWHSHHVNGLSTLSVGDVATYQRTVNHPCHNTSFFYALLVTRKGHSGKPLRRYQVKHYLFRRGDDRVYRIPRRQVRVVTELLMWPVSAESRRAYGQDSPAHRLTSVHPDHETQGV